MILCYEFIIFIHDDCDVVMRINFKLSTRDKNYATAARGPLRIPFTAHRILDMYANIWSVFPIHNNNDINVGTYTILIFNVQRIRAQASEKIIK